MSAGAGRDRRRGRTPPARWGGRSADRATARAAPTLVAVVALSIAATASSASWALATAPNLALGRPYTMVPKPNYQLSLDPGDATQLTDGVVSNQNPLWSQRTTVGWQNADSVDVTIDLGSLLEIDGISFRTAGGKAGVGFPSAIETYVSDDGRRWRWVADLASLFARSGGGFPAGYAITTIRGDGLGAQGRFVRLLIAPRGPFVLSDEIEVIDREGGAATTFARAPFVDPLADFQQRRLLARIKQATTRDLTEARKRVEASKLDGREREALFDRLGRAEVALAALEAPDPGSFVAAIPMNAAQAEAFAVVGTLEAAEGAPPISAWGADPAAFLQPLDRPGPGSGGTLSQSFFPSEARAVAFNVRNSTGQEAAIDVEVDLPPAAERLVDRVYEVAWTETRAGDAVASALPDAPRKASGFSIRVPAGMTRQVYLRLSGAGVRPGRHAGTIRIVHGGERVASLPLEVQVYEDVLPAPPRLHVGGWDYVERDRIYDLTPENRAPLTELLRSRNVDTTWAAPGTLGFGRIDAATGELRAPPPTDRFDGWVSRWPGARRYMVFLNVGDDIQGVASGDPRFETMVRGWLEFWASHARSRGISPEKIHLSLVDEPAQAPALERAARWATAVRHAGTGIRVWENPTPKSTSDIPAALVENSDLLCANRALGRVGGSAYWSFFAAASKQRQVGVYGALGPARNLDPYAYYRLQAWRSFAIGGSESSFWSFIDAGLTSSWNELAATGESFTPLFLARDAATTAKQLEAIAEAAFDFEILSALEDSLGRAGAANAGEARELLTRGVASVLEGPGAEEIEWDVRRDRSLADTVRRRASELLVEITRSAVSGNQER